MDAGYRILPPYYDRWQRSYGKDFSALILPRLLATIRSYRISGPGMVDVACGTGTLALMMARRGWKVFGVDASEGMLACAAEKPVAKALDVSFLLQDMRELRLPARVNLATSFFDSLNHLLNAEDLARTFRRVRDALVPMGYFVFDLNNERCFSTLWTQSETVTGEGFTLLLENSYDRGTRTALSNVTITPKGGKGQILQETVHEHYYPADEVRALLRQSGFSVKQCEDFNFTSNPAVGKLKTWWVAECADD